MAIRYDTHFLVPRPSPYGYIEDVDNNLVILQPRAAPHEVPDTRHAWRSVDRPLTWPGLVRGWPRLCPPFALATRRVARALTLVTFPRLPRHLRRFVCCGGVRPRNRALVATPKTCRIRRRRSPDTTTPRTHYWLCDELNVCLERSEELRRFSLRRCPVARKDVLDTHFRVS